MTDFNYNTNVPFSTNNPASDQPQMLINTQQNALIWNVDHVGFNANNGGTHLQVTFSSENPPPGSITDPMSVLYTNQGQASTIAQLYWQNQIALFNISLIKAYGQFTSSSSPTFSNELNCTGISYDSGNNQFNITFSSNVFTGTPGVLLSVSNPAGNIAYSFSGSTLQIKRTFIGSGSIVTFAILQA